MLENNNTVATICIESMNTMLQRDVTIVLQTQDGTANGKYMLFGQLY